MRDICQVLVRISAGKVTFERLLEFYAEPGESDGYGDLLAPSDSGFYMDLRGVEIAHPGGGGLFAIDSLRIGGNGLYQLAGKNGSGKTTFINLLANAERSDGFRIMQGGHVKINERFLSDVARYAAPRVFFPGTARYNILVDREPCGRFDEIVSVLGIDFLDKEIDPASPELSLGEAAKVSLARALLPGRKIVVLDEPFANLDSDTTCRVARYLKRSAESSLLIVVTHDDALENVRDCLLEIDGGRMVAAQSPPAGENCP